MAKTILATTLSLMATVALVSSQGAAPTVVGDWQGSLSAGQGIRVVLKVAAMDAAGGKATLYLVDQSPDGIPVASVTQNQTRIVFTIPSVGAAIEGTVSADGGSIHAAWIQGQNSVPLTLERPTKTTAWATDTSPHTVKFVTVDDAAKVRLEVLDWGGS